MNQISQTQFGCLLLDATASSFDKSINQYLDLLTERRSISFVELEADNVTKEFIAEDGEINDYFNNNLEQFSIPEKKILSFTEFNIKAK